MKVAYYSPLPPSRSGIADYSALLLPALESRIGVELARHGRFRRAPKADVAVYHVGNDPEAHGWIVEALRRRRGVVVLHELVLHHLVAGITLARGDAAGYLAAMERDHGLAIEFPPQRLSRGREQLPDEPAIGAGQVHAGPDAPGLQPAGTTASNPTDLRHGLGGEQLHHIVIVQDGPGTEGLR